MTISFTSNLEFLAYQKASLVCKLFKVSPEEKDILEDKEISSLDVLKAFFDTKAYKDIISFIVFSLTLSSAISWGYDCLIKLSNFERKAKGLDISIANWLKDSTPENRTVVYQQAEDLNFSNAWGLLGTAVFWSGGNISPPDKPEVMISEQVTRSMIANAIILAALEGEVASIEQRFLVFIESGLETLRRTNKKEV